MSADGVETSESPRTASLADALPGLLSFKGKPLNSVDYLPFRPYYSSSVPEVTVLRAGRGVGKSIAMMARLLLHSGFIPHLQSMVVCPLMAQSDRLSEQYMLPILSSSPIRTMLCPDGDYGAVRRRRFFNGSLVNFLYAYLKVDQIRGFHNSCAIIDEAQDMDPEFIPIILECVSQRPKIITFGGTSKTNDTTLEKQYLKSTMSVWHTPCNSCGKVAVAACHPHGQIEKMIGPWSPDISEKRPGTVCPWCQKPISPRHGWWNHRRPEMAGRSLGLHIPQIIMPDHYANPRKWQELLEKRDSDYGIGKFYNEVLGEPFDSAHRLLSVEQVKSASILPIDGLEKAVAYRRAAGYHMVVAGIDWSGGGEDGSSRTAISIVALSADGGVDVLYGEKRPLGEDSLDQVKRILQVCQAFEVNLVAHDYNGNGAARQDLMRVYGLPDNRTAPIVYASVGSSLIVSFLPASGNRTRGYYHVDKPRSLSLTAEAIKRGKIRFFKDDYKSDDSPGILRDFTYLVEHYVDSGSRARYSVRRMSDDVSDDFAQATNMATWICWHYTGSHPSFLN